MLPMNWTHKRIMGRTVYQFQAWTVLRQGTRNRLSRDWSVYHDGKWVAKFRTAKRAMEATDWVITLKILIPEQLDPRCRVLHPDVAEASKLAESEAERQQDFARRILHP